jgi:predicted ribosomally synthesized peptide with SipW-like signal peptide
VKQEVYSVRTLIPALLLLAVISGALAMWYDTLKINATIETGYVDIEFSGTPSVDEGMEYGKPWVASCSAQLVEVQDEDPNNPAGNNDLDLKIVISNAYPCYHCKVSNVLVKNTGSVPVKLDTTVYIIYGSTEIECSAYEDQATGETKYACDTDGNGKADIVVWGCFTSLDGKQIEPGGTQSFTVDIHVEQDAEQKSTYTVEIIIRGIQWNEY